MLAVHRDCLYPFLAQGADGHANEGYRCFALVHGARRSDETTIQGDMVLFYFISRADHLRHRGIVTRLRPDGEPPFEYPFKLHLASSGEGELDHASSHEVALHIARHGAPGTSIGVWIHHVDDQLDEITALKGAEAVEFRWHTGRKRRCPADEVDKAFEKLELHRSKRKSQGPSGADEDSGASSSVSTKAALDEALADSAGQSESDPSGEDEDRQPAARPICPTSAHASVERKPHGKGVNIIYKEKVVAFIYQWPGGVSCQCLIHKHCKTKGFKNLLSDTVLVDWALSAIRLSGSTRIGRDRHLREQPTS